MCKNKCCDIFTPVVLPTIVTKRKVLEVITAPGPLSVGEKNSESILDPNTFGSVMNVILPVATNQNTVKKISLAIGSTYDCTVTLKNAGNNNNGTFILSPPQNENIMSKTLVFKGQTWYFKEATSLFPSAQVGDKITATVPQLTSEYGVAVACRSDGLRAITTAPLYNSTGTVYASKKSEYDGIWTQTQIIAPNPADIIDLQNIGRSTCMSADGKFAVFTAQGTAVGKPGAAFIMKYSKATDSWKIVQKVSAENATNFFGYASAMNADGSRLLIGDIGNNGGNGAVYIYQLKNKSGFRGFNNENEWEQVEMLVGKDLSSGASLGSSIAVDASGTKIAVGAPNDNDNVGAVVTYKTITSACGNNNNTRKTKQTGILRASDVTGSPSQGYSVAITPDGKYIGTGGIHDNSETGAGWVWKRSNGKYLQQGLKLVPTTDAPNTVSFLGWAVAFDALGGTLVIGAPKYGFFGPDPLQGGSFVYRRTTNGTWIQQGGVLQDSECVLFPFGSFEGCTIGLDSRGGNAYIGGYDDNAAIGATTAYA